LQNVIVGSTFFFSLWQIRVTDKVEARNICNLWSRIFQRKCKLN